jgi:hypothetical protein
MLSDAPAPPVVHIEERPAEWTLLRVGPSGRTIVIGAWGGGCGGRLRATVAKQDDAAVTLKVTFPVPVSDDPQDPVMCPAIARKEIATVKLDAPLDGRALPGQARIHVSLPPTAARLPRLIGARARDALRSLRNQLYHGHLAGPIDGEVVREKRSGARQGGRDVTIVAAARR